MQSRAVTGVVLALTSLLAPCSTEAAIQLQLLTSGLDRPVAITHAGDGSGRLFITEQAGRIRIHDGVQLLPTPFLDIGSLVTSGGEQGLLSVAFHPQSAANGTFFVFYTDTVGNGRTVVARYTVSANPDVADPASGQVILTVTQPFTNHNGGQLQFGPDGYLYIGLGDGGSGGDPQNNAQNLGTLLGSLLRIDVDGGAPYAIPPTNPFVGSPFARDEIWAYGLRNPWRFSFDRTTGDLFIGDVGQNELEEVDLQQAGSQGGQNYGWRLMEGSQCFNPVSNCNPGGLILPILEYSHALGCSITGGYRYRGASNPSEAGTYFYGDFCTGRIWGAAPDGGGGWSATERMDTSLSISAFGEDEIGELLVAHLGSGTSSGEVYRLVGFAPLPPPLRTLTVARQGDGAGTVTSVPAGIACGTTCASLYVGGTTVTLMAVPDAGSYFAGFAGAPACVDGRLVLTGDTLCTATFVLGSPLPAPQPTAGGAGVVDYLPGRLDLNADGRGDAVLYRPVAGGAASLLEDGSRARAVAPILPILPILDASSTHEWSPGWTIKSGDFNGDSRSDLFFYDVAIGTWFKGISTTPPGGPASYNFHGGTWSPGWSVAVLELNGDGRADVFLYDAVSGAWYRGVSSDDGTGDFSFVGGTWSPGWQIHPVRLNADGVTDLCLYNVTTGEWFRAVNDGGDGFTFAAGTWSPGWQVNPGDYDGDGLTDLFLYDVATGAWYVGFNRGAGWTYVGGAFSPEWTVRPGDFDGDGRTDLLLYDVTTGAWFQSLADGAGGWTHLPGAWSPGWEVHVTRVDPDVRADVLLYNPVSGGYFQGISSGPGTFTYLGGVWGAGLGIVASSP